MVPVFEYQARSKNGKKINGTITAEEPSMVVDQLREQGYYVTSVNKKVEKKDVSEYLNPGKRVKIKDLAIFSQQFAILINAGVSLVDAIILLQKQTDNNKMNEVLEKIRGDIETGSSLSEAFSRHPDVFPGLYTQLIRAGEAGSLLNDVLNNLAVHYEKQDELSGKIKSALYYPVTILSVTIFVVLLLLVFVVPTFVTMFEDLGGELPGPTLILLGISGLLRNYWWVIFLFLIGFYFAIKKYISTSAGKYIFDKMILKIPKLGDMMGKVVISRFTSTLSMLLNSGVDIISGLNIVEDVVGNSVFVRLLTESRSSIKEGSSFSEPLSESKEFPPMVVHMIRVGEETGQIDVMLEKISHFYDREVDSVVEGLISIIEPVMMVVLAVVVGFIVISIVMPMFEMYTHIM